MYKAMLSTILSRRQLSQCFDWGSFGLQIGSD
jgi:hypothetical protein